MSSTSRTPYDAPSRPVGTHVKVGRGLVEGALATDGVPFVLETPGSGDPTGPCLPLLKKLRDA